MVMEMDPMTLFQTIYSGFGEHLTEHDVMNGFDEMDTKGNSKISCKEFKLFARDHHLDKTYARAKDAFDVLSDGESNITLITFKRYVNNPSPPEEALEFVTKLLGGWAYDPESMPVGAREMSMSRIKDLISDKQLKTDWKDRIRALQSFTRQVCRYSKQKFEKIMRKYAMFYTFQLRDRRTKVHRCVCMSIAKIAMSQTIYMLKIVPRLLNALFEYGIRSKIQTVADNAAQAALALIRHVPDTNKGVILKVLLKNCQDKLHNATRMGAFGLLSLSLAADFVFKVDRTMEDWKRIADVVSIGIRDKDEDVRHNAFSCLAQLEGTRFDLTKPVLEKLSKVQNDSYENVKQYVDLTNPALFITESIQAGALLKEDEESEYDLDPAPALSPLILSPCVAYSENVLKSQRLPLAQSKRRYTTDEDMWEVNEYEELLDDIIGIIETDGSKFTTKEEMGRFFPGLDISVLPENLLVDSDALRPLFPNLSKARDAYQQAYSRHIEIITPRVFGSFGDAGSWENKLSGVRPEIQNMNLSFSSPSPTGLTSDDLDLEPILSVSSPKVHAATQELEHLQNQRNNMLQGLFSSVNQDDDLVLEVSPSLRKLQEELADAEARTQKRGFEVLKMQKELRVMIKDSNAPKTFQIQTPRGAFDLTSQLELDFYNQLVEQERENNQYLEEIVAQQNEDQSMSIEVLESKVSKMLQEANRRQSAHYDEVTELKDQIEELTEQLEKEESNQSHHRQELKSEIRKLGTEHTQTVSNLNNLTHESDILKLTVNSNASKLQRLGILSTQLKASQTVVVNQDNEIKALQNKLDSVQNDLRDKTKQFYTMMERTKGLEQTLHEGTAQKKSDMEVLTRKIDEMQNQMQNLQIQDARREAESSTLARLESMDLVDHAEHPGYCGISSDPCCVQ